MSVVISIFMDHCICSCVMQCERSFALKYLFTPYNIFIYDGMLFLHITNFFIVFNDWLQTPSILRKLKSSLLQKNIYIFIRKKVVILFMTMMWCGIFWIVLFSEIKRVWIEVEKKLRLNCVFFLLPSIP